MFFIDGTQHIEDVSMCVCSAPSPVLQSVADPDMHAPEISLTATPAALPVESKGLQTEETEIPQVTYLQRFTL